MTNPIQLKWLMFLLRLFVRKMFISSQNQNLFHFWIWYFWTIIFRIVLFSNVFQKKEIFSCSYLLLFFTKDRNLCKVRDCVSFSFFLDSLSFFRSISASNAHRISQWYYSKIQRSCSSKWRNIKKVMLLHSKICRLFVFLQKSILRIL